MQINKIILAILFIFICSGCTNQNPKVQGSMEIDKRDREIIKLLKKKAEELAESNIDFIVINGSGVYCLKESEKKDYYKKTNISLKIEGNYKDNKFKKYNVYASKLPAGTEIYYINDTADYITYMNNELLYYRCKKVLINNK